MTRGLVALCAALAFASPAMSATVFSDSFEADTFNLAQTNLINFTAITGNVDIVGPTSFSIACSNGGKCIDIDGTNTAGPTMLQSKSTYTFGAGDTLRLSADVSGNQRPGAGSAFDTFSLGFSFNGNTSLSNYGSNLLGGSDSNFGPSLISGFSSSFGLNPTDPFGRRSIFFTAAQAGSVSFSFGTDSADNYGPILDNVALDRTSSAVPEPATWAMMICGFGLVGGVMRRRYRNVTTTVRFA